jgi:hypothetical protein
VTTPKGIRNQKFSGTVEIQLFLSESEGMNVSQVLPDSILYSELPGGGGIRMSMLQEGH